MNLHLIILIPTFSLVDSFSADSLLAVTLIVLLLPIMAFGIMQFLVYKKKILKLSQVSDLSQMIPPTVMMKIQ